jgi:hypothetical protein
MKSFIAPLLAAGMALGLSAGALADTVTLGIDAAPNGGAGFTAWRTNAFSTLSDGAFVNMANSHDSANIGTTTFDALDAIVYSTLDRGTRLHWVYWLPGETVESLSGRFEVRTVADWEGVDYTFDAAGNYLVDNGTNGFAQPGSWVNYDSDGDSINDGVIGTFGNAWWAYDDLAPVHNTDTNFFNEVDQADIDQMAADMYQVQTYWRGEVRIRDSAGGDWQKYSLQGNLTQVVPTPTAAFGGLALMGLSLLRRRRQLS